MVRSPLTAPMGRLFRISIAVLLLAGCAEQRRGLDELIVVDSVYLDPVTREPWTGPVFRAFDDDPGSTQLEGDLLEGAWDGDLRVYHPNGRIRYMGSFRGGDRCGPWTENSDSVPTESVYDALIREVETMGLYPACDGSR
jgi:hypothetical protein